MAAPVVPEQVRLRHPERDAVVEDAFEVFAVEVVLVRRVHREEGGGRHLLRVADDDGASAARQRSDRFAGRQLRGFVEDY